MKKIAIFVLFSLSVIPLCSCGSSFKKTNSSNYDIIPLIGEDEVTDYSNPNNWLYCETEAEHDVDLIYFYPTVTFEPNYYVVSKVSREMKEGATWGFADTGSCFAPYTNLFIPFTTQFPITLTKEVQDEYFQKYNIDPSKVIDYFDILTYSHVRTDVYAALDYYFEHYNHNRPFILAGHSQGSAICQIVLEEYMRVHPEFLSRMVVTYSGGFSVSRQYLRDNPHLKYAEGETDTGVIVSWTTEAPGATEHGVIVQPDSECINILNWKKDETRAPRSLNKGSRVSNNPIHTYITIKPGVADAQLDLKNGVMIADINLMPDLFKIDAPNFIFGDKSYHTCDYWFYYENLRENGLKRIESFLGRETK